MKKIEWKKTWDQYKYIALVLLLGVGLLLWPHTEESVASVEIVSSSVDDVEQQMEEILSKISGVGELELMLTMENTGTTELASDTSLSYSGNVSAPDAYARQSDVVTVSGSDGNQGIVTQQSYPTYRGALVVCQGGDNAEVKLAVINSVAALTGLGTDRIMVVKWQ